MPPPASARSIPPWRSRRRGCSAILTGEDVIKAGFANFASRVPRKRPDGSPSFVPPYRPLAVGRVQHVGDPVAAIVAETLHEAKDAAELVEVDYEILPSVTDTAATLAPSAPAVWDEVPDNLCFVHKAGDKPASDAAFARAHHVARERFLITRVTTNSMEGRTALAEYDRRQDRYTLHAGLQAVHGIRQEIAAGLQAARHQLPPDLARCRRRLRHEGEPLSRADPGALGGAAHRPAGEMDRRAQRGADLRPPGPRQYLATWSWPSTRTASSWRSASPPSANLGAYLALNGTLVPVNNMGGLAGVYTIPAFDVTISGVFSNTLPTSPYRGAGRPEASYCIERIIDIAARDMGIDQVELRRRNMIPASAMPYKTALVYTYDSGEFETVMDKAWNSPTGRASRRAVARRSARGKLRGIGIACVIEIAGGPARRAAWRKPPRSASTPPAAPPS